MKRSMALVKSRQTEIINLLTETPDKSIKELSEIFKVSELTIRRDLEQLQKDGILVRKRGGAALYAEHGETLKVSYANKDGKNLMQKKLIAQKAAEFVSDGDSVFINAGTTTLEVIKLLLPKKITILTNNAVASSVFTAESEASLISTGGEFNYRNRSYHGQMAASMINMVFASVCILGINGIAADAGLTTASYPETMINEEFIKRCKGKIIVVADGSKVGKTYSFGSGTMKQIDYLVTDESADKEQIEKIRELGTEVIIVK